MTNEITIPSKKITVGLIFSWMFGLLFALAGVVSVFSEPILGITMLVMSAVLLPPINKLVDRKWKFHLSGGIKTLVIIIGFFTIGLTTDTSNTVEQQNNQPQIKQEQKQPASNTEQQKVKIGDVIMPDREIETIMNEEVEPPEEPEVAPTSDEKQSETVEEKQTETLSQKNAIRKAKSYLDISGFSRSGLMEQLEFEGFTTQQATYGVNAIGL